VRTDLSETERRRLVWMRREACRKLGRMFDGLVERRIPPGRFLDGVEALYQAELERDSGYSEAA
jgi:hypothetical protein